MVCIEECSAVYSSQDGIAISIRRFLHQPYLYCRESALAGTFVRDFTSVELCERLMRLWDVPVHMQEGREIENVSGNGNENKVTMDGLI